MKKRIPLLVVAQFALGAGVFLVRDWSWRDTTAHALILAGAALMVWALVSIGGHTINMTPHVRSTARLCQRGPYRIVRHPMYLAQLLAGFGCAFLPFATIPAICWIVWLVVLLLKIRLEERLLIERFPEYETYRTQVATLLPLVY